MKQNTEKQMTNTEDCPVSVPAANSKDGSIVPPFKGFCAKAQKVHNTGYIKRYLTGLMKEHVFPTPLNEVKYITKTPDA